MRIWCAALAAVTAACGLDTSGDAVDSSSTASTTADSVGPDTVDPSSGTTPPADTSGTAGTTDDSATTEPTGTSGDDTTTTGAPGFEPFGPPVALGELNAADASDDDPTLRGDLLEIYFATNRDNGVHEDLWRATRESPDDPFDAPEAVSGLNTPTFNDTTPELSHDGLTLWFASDRTNMGQLDVFVTTRRSTDPGDAWGEPERARDLSSEWNEGAPVITTDGLQAWFCRAQPEGISALFRGTRPSRRGPWNVAAFTALATAQEECSPWVSAAGDEVWFGSNRPEGAGEFDLWVAEVSGDDVVSLRNLDELNGPEQDDDPWLSADGTTLVFASDRDGSLDLFVATRALR